MVTCVIVGEQAGSVVRQCVSIARRCLALIGLLSLAACAPPEGNRAIILSRVMLGEQFLRNDEYGKAYDILEGVAAGDPTSSAAALSLADAYYRHGAYMKAAASYSKAVELDAQVDGRLGLARVELARSNPHAARAYLQDVLVHEPDNLQALNSLGVAYELFGKPDLAQQAYQHVLALDPTNKNAHNNLALSLALNGQAQVALPRIAELSRANLDDKAIRQNLAIIEFLADNTVDAMRVAKIDLTDREARQNFRSLDYYRKARSGAFAD